MPKIQHKILVLMTSRGWGGLELNTLRLIKAMQDAGVEVHVFVRDQSRFHQVLPETIPCFSRQQIIKYADYKTAWRISKYCRKYEITNLLATFREDVDLMAWTKVLSRRKLYVMYQQHMQLGMSKKSWVHRWRYKHIDAWLAPMHWLRDEAKRYTTVPDERIHLVPIGLSQEILTKSALPKEQARKELDLPDGFVLGVVGRIDRKKGQLFVLEALYNHGYFSKNNYLLIVGEPTADDPQSVLFYDELCAFIEQHSLQHSVIRLPFQKDMTLCYSAMDTLVVASESETLGMVTLEAMHFGVPVVGTAAGGTKELLSEGRGYLFEAGDQYGFIHALSELKTKDTQNQQGNNKAWISTHFTTDQEVQYIVTLLR